jgi:hypothetical protein
MGPCVASAIGLRYREALKIWISANQQRLAKLLKSLRTQVFKGVVQAKLLRAPKSGAAALRYFNRLHLQVHVGSASGRLPACQH